MSVPRRASRSARHSGPPRLLAPWGPAWTGASLAAVITIQLLLCRLTALLFPAIRVQSAACLRQCGAASSIWLDKRRHLLPVQPVPCSFPRPFKIVRQRRRLPSKIRPFPPRDCSSSHRSDGICTAPLSNRRFLHAAGPSAIVRTSESAVTLERCPLSTVQRIVHVVT